MLTDEQYGRDLGDQLRLEMADVRADPDLLRQLRRRGARRTWAISSAIAVPVAVAAVAAVIVTTSGPGGPVRSTTAAPNQQIVDVAYVKAQTIKAVGRAEDYVIYSKDTGSGGYYETWTDCATQRYRVDTYDKNSPMQRIGEKAPKPPAGGYPLHHDQTNLVTGPEGNQDILTIDWPTKRWYTSHDSSSRPAGGVPNPTDPDSVRKAINDGTVQLVGKEQVDGRDTLHLLIIGPDHSSRIDMWVDSTSYLPVKDIAVKDQSTKDEESTTYTWLPRTAENLAKLVVTPPAGFEHAS
jgi:hypothetical protein